MRDGHRRLWRPFTFTGECESLKILVVLSALVLVKRMDLGSTQVRLVLRKTLSPPTCPFHHTSPPLAHCNEVHGCVHGAPCHMNSNPIAGWQSLLGMGGSDASMHLL